MVKLQDARSTMRRFWQCPICGTTQFDMGCEMCICCNEDIEDTDRMYCDDGETEVEYPDECGDEF